WLISIGRSTESCNRRKTGQCTTVVEEESDSMERETTVGHVQFIAGRDQDNWQRKIVAGCDVDRLQRKIVAGSFLPQGIIASCDQGGWQREVTVGSIVQFGICAAVKGIREVGWLKGWWTEGCGFWGWFCGYFGCGLGL
ncbi:hypothetical protein GW17_00043214, partial [Ensete ventricosum]